MTSLKLKRLALALSVATLPARRHGRSVADDVQHPMWYKEPSAKTMELAAIDDLSNTVVSDGQRGEPGFPAADLKLTDEQIEKVKAGGNSPSASRWAGSATTGPRSS